MDGTRGIAYHMHSQVADVDLERKQGQLEQVLGCISNFCARHKRDFIVPGTEQVFAGCKTSQALFLTG